MSDITRASILDEAGRYVHVDRNSNYGDPEDNFGVIAEIMTAYLSRRFKIRIPVAPYDVANLMFAVKLGRLAHFPLHHDSYVDMAGYAAAGGEVAAIHRNDAITRLDQSELARHGLAVFGDLEDILHDVAGELSAA
jgi:hypothetical protein